MIAAIYCIQHAGWIKLSSPLDYSYYISTVKIRQWEPPL